MQIETLTAANRAEVNRYIREEWGGPLLVTLGRPYDTTSLPGFAAVEGEQLLGAVLCRVENAECEVAVLFALRKNQGVGTALMNQAKAYARQQGCTRLWLVTTNDNTHAIRYYQKYGMDLKAVHIGSFEAVRRFKPDIPACGEDGIPLKHEFEFEMLLQNRTEIR